MLAGSLARHSCFGAPAQDRPHTRRRRPHGKPRPVRVRHVRARRSGAGCRHDFRAPRPLARHAFHLEARGSAEPRLLLRTLRSALHRLRRAGSRQKRAADGYDPWPVRHDRCRELYRRVVRRPLYRHHRVRLSCRPLRPPRSLHVFAAVVHRRQRRDGFPGERYGSQLLAFPGGRRHRRRTCHDRDVHF